jgi:hypothetical protein
MLLLDSPTFRNQLVHGTAVTRPHSFLPGGEFVEGEHGTLIFLSQPQEFLCKCLQNKISKKDMKQNQAAEHISSSMPQQGLSIFVPYIVMK